MREVGVGGGARGRVAGTFHERYQLPPPPPPKPPPLEPLLLKPLSPEPSVPGRPSLIHSRLESYRTNLAEVQADLADLVAQSVSTGLRAI